MILSNLHKNHSVGFANYLNHRDDISMCAVTQKGQQCRDVERKKPFRLFLHRQHPVAHFIEKVIDRSAVGPGGDLNCKDSATAGRNAAPNEF